jgi:hypothetical protein
MPVQPNTQPPPAAATLLPTQSALLPPHPFSTVSFGQHTVDRFDRHPAIMPTGSHPSGTGFCGGQRSHGHPGRLHACLAASTHPRARAETGAPLAATHFPSACRRAPSSAPRLLAAASPNERVPRRSLGARNVLVRPGSEAVCASCIAEWAAAGRIGPPAGTDAAPLPSASTKPGVPLRPLRPFL